MEETTRCAYLVGTDGARGTVRAVDFDVERRPLWLLPLAQTEAFQLYAKFDHKNPDVSPEGIRRMIHERTGQPDLAVRDICWASLFASRLGMAEQFRMGRVFVAGDAAHVHSPAGGQGMKYELSRIPTISVGNSAKWCSTARRTRCLTRMRKNDYQSRPTCCSSSGKFTKTGWGPVASGQPQGDSQQTASITATARWRCRSLPTALCKPAIAYPMRH